jgi:hypothetical protein
MREHKIYATVVFFNHFPLSKTFFHKNHRITACLYCQTRQELGYQKFVEIKIQKNSNAELHLKVEIRS